MVSIKNKALKRLSTGLLAGLLVLTTVFNSFALGDSAHGNDVSGAVTGRGGDFSANISNDYTSGKIGIRLSLVNRDNPQEILSVEDDGVTPRVVDYLYVTADTFARQVRGSIGVDGTTGEAPYNSVLSGAFTYTSVKTQDLSSLATKNTPKIDWHYYDELLLLFPESNMPPWLAHNGSYYSKGTEFVNWSRQDDMGNEALTGGAIYTTNPYGIPLKIEKGESKRKGTYYAVVDLVDMSDLTRTYKDNLDEYEYTKWVKAFYEHVCVKNVVSKLSGELVSDYTYNRELEQYYLNLGQDDYNSAFMSLYSFMSRATVAVEEVKSKFGEDSQMYKELAGMYNNTLNSNEYKQAYRETYSAFQEYKRKAVINFASEHGIDMNSPYLKDIDSLSGDELDSLLQQLLKQFSVSEPSHIQRLLEYGPEKVEGKPTEYYLQTKSMVEAHKKDEELSLQTCSEDWVLLVEPIVWLTIYPEGIDKPVIHNKMYGTITNIAQAFTIEPDLKNKYADNTKTFNWKALNGPVWSALSVDSKGFAFNGDNGLFIEPTVPSGSFRSFRSLANANIPVVKAQTVEIDGQQVVQNRPTIEGYGVNVYWKDMFKTEICTWDSETFPQADPGPAPDPTNLPKEPQYGSENKKFIITKWYVEKFIDEDGKERQVVVDVQTRRDTPHTVGIVNEGSLETDNYWLIDMWATGTQELVPTDGDTSTTFEQYYKKNTIVQAGTEPLIIEPKPEDKEKILYVKLIKTELPDINYEGDLKIVKVKDNPDGTTTVTTEEGSSTNGKYNANETGWTYLEDMQTSKDPATVNKWTDVPVDGTPGATPDITVKEDTKTIYIHYTQDNPTPPGKSPIVLHQNELSRGYTLQSLVANGTLASLQERFISLAGSVRLCGGHHVGCSNHSGGHTRYGGSTSRKIDDGNYTLSLTSSNTNPNFILDYEQVGDTWRVWGLLGISGGNSHLLTPNASYLLYRDKSKDLVTPYPGKNADRAILSKLGIGADSAVPRARINTTGAGKFYNKFATNFTKASDYDHTLNWKWYCSYKGRYEEWGYWDGYQVSGKTISDINEAYTYDNNVEIRYELGTVGQGLTAPQNTRETDFANVFYNNPFVSVQQDGDIVFYPYTKMQYYDKSNSEAGKKDIFVTSTNTSTIKAFTKIESGVWKNSGHDDATVNGNNPDPNITLDSTQWSTHKNSLNFLDEMNADDKKSVLPGGATFDVSMKADTSEWSGESGDRPTTSTKLGYRVWQTCIEDGRIGLLAPNSTVQTVTEAKQRVNELDNSIKDAIPSYGLVQTVMKGAVDYEGYLGNYTQGAAYEVVTNGGTWNSIPLSSDAKYYLKLLENKGAGQEFNSSITNFDILKGGIVKQKLYTIGSDTQGDVYVLLDGTEIGRIHSTDTVEQLLNQSADIKLVDNATKIVTNYIKAIDRNRGADRNGKAWYNEAFDGVNVLYSYLSYDIGFGNGIAGSPGAGGKGTAVRSAILDPKLTGALANKSDLYNFEEDSRDTKVRSSMILTGQAGVANGLKQPTGEIGKMTLKNGGTIQVKLENMSIFAYSKMFYIPNANVSDLN